MAGGLDVAVYRSERDGEPEELLTLSGCVSRVRPFRVGSRAGLAGVVSTTDVGGARAVQAACDVQRQQRIRHPLVWLVVDDRWVRVRGFTLDGGVCGPGRVMRIQCSNMWVSKSVVPGGADAADRVADLVLVEPSPPRPWRDWVDTERAAAVQDWRLAHA